PQYTASHHLHCSLLCAASPRFREHVSVVPACEVKDMADLERAETARSVCRIPSSVIQERYGAWVSPDSVLAEKRYHELNSHHTTFKTFKTPLSEFKEWVCQHSSASLQLCVQFGPGHLLYFTFLKHMAVLFLVLALTSAVVHVSLFSGGGFLGASSGLDAASLGNYGLASSNLNLKQLNISRPLTNKGADTELVVLRLFLADAVNPPVIMASQPAVDKRDGIVTLSVLDLVGTLFYCGFCVFFIWRTRQLEQRVSAVLEMTSMCSSLGLVQVEANNITIHDYSVRAEGVPPDTTVDEASGVSARWHRHVTHTMFVLNRSPVARCPQVGRWFSQWGEVCLVECARRCNELMELVVERGCIVAELDHALALLQRTAELEPEVDEALELDVLNLKYDLSIVTKALQARQLAQNGLDVVDAYITYKSGEGRDACLAAQPRTLYQRWTWPSGLRFRGKHMLRVSPAPEPEDIRFENLEFKRVNRVFRTILTFVLKALAVLLGFVLVSLAPSIKRTLNIYSGGPSDSTCDASCSWRDSSGTPYLNTTLRSEYRSCYITGLDSSSLPCQGTGICYECYCRASLAQGNYADTAYCSPFSTMLVLATGTQVLTVFAIVIVNLLVALIMARLTRFEKHHTRSQEARSLLSALFATQFFNSAFSTLIANMYLPGVQEKMEGLWVNKLVFGGTYADFTPNWYRDVGRSLLISHFAGLLVRLAWILMLLLNAARKRREAPKALTQAELDASYQGHHFDELAVRYGEHLTVIFVCMVFCAGMPLFLWSAAVSFVIHYWVERYELLKVCQRPGIYTSDLARIVARLLPFAVLWHLPFASWMYSVIGVPRSRLVGDGPVFSLFTGLAAAMAKVWDGTSGLSPDVQASRLASDNSAHLLAGWLLTALVLFFALTMQWWIALAKWLSRCSSSRIAPDGQAGDEVLARPFPVRLDLPDFVDALRSKQLLGPDTYDMTRNRFYSSAFARIRSEKLSDDLLQRVAEMEEQERHDAGSLPMLDRRAAKRRTRREHARELLRNHGSELRDAGVELQHVKPEQQEDRRSANLKDADGWTPEPPTSPDTVPVTVGPPAASPYQDSAAGRSEARESKSSGNPSFISTPVAWADDPRLPGEVATPGGIASTSAGESKGAAPSTNTRGWSSSSPSANTIPWPGSGPSAPSAAVGWLGAPASQAAVGSPEIAAAGWSRNDAPFPVMPQPRYP
ncbi:hypothetical protein QJQ45_023445, partial [Haematococcus lacustris]